MSASRWTLMDLPSYLSSSWAFRWPEVNLSSLSSGWNMRLLSLSGDLSIVDDLLWSFVSIIESLAITATVCCFFLFCGCTL
ncbi:transmembrane protein [Arabidopsis thaliana]|uniref:At5g49525 n=1 Tax=Arabidopsis thaliana TaxID=3702 RepID=Q8L7F0_ARATH|nr:uncharacterized protein AT5G49525 [Arabidopsis thaliana]AAM96958.1 unknown protein [Arabidopsis thaliana]AAP21317.1 At5g49525 [Arabidopsis thaliana]AED95825.1 transmembrane protein [Arabidopsis thaliana]BAD94064.1 hypothetical protein [Arabidopsis thaliana]BAD95373.1 hypothetical protein [Arabidopsis thaliana]|eukprot:NP_850924.1 transmembrane protein [Arabidopsis thaliana]